MILLNAPHVRVYVCMFVQSKLRTKLGIGLGACLPRSSGRTRVQVTQPGPPGKVGVITGSFI